MRNSSARQIDPEYTSTASANPADQSLFVSTSPDLPSANTAETSVLSSRTSALGVSSDLYAATARRAGRLNAASVSDKEYNDLLNERQRLLDRKLDGTISRKNSIRLQYVRWSLDRIEDAKYGAALEELESSVVKYEQFLSDLQELKTQLSSRKTGHRR